MEVKEPTASVCGLYLNASADQVKNFTHHFDKQKSSQKIEVTKPNYRHLNSNSVNSPLSAYTQVVFNIMNKINLLQTKMFFYLLTRFLKDCQENNRTVFGSGKVPQQFYGTSTRYAMVKTIGLLILIKFIHYNNNIVNNDSGKINCRKHFHGLQAPCLYARTNLMYSYKSNDNKQAKYIYRLY